MTTSNLEKKCRLEHVQNSLNLFADYHNKEIRLKRTELKTLSIKLAKVMQEIEVLKRQPQTQ
jgi:hypothetical protein